MFIMQIGIIARLQVFSQPNGLKVAGGLAFQLTAAADAIDIAVEVELDQHAGGISGLAWAKAGNRVLKLETGQVQCVDISVNRPYRVIWGHIPESVFLRV